MTFLHMFILVLKVLENPENKDSYHTFSMQYAYYLYNVELSNLIFYDSFDVCKQFFYCEIFFAYECESSAIYSYGVLLEQVFAKIELNIWMR